jgi:alpha-beta hydrolase superfamily lysophospholipase
VTLTAADNTPIEARLWKPEKVKPAGVVLIVHGMAEHIDRYDAFARFLGEEGLAVLGMNLRGHGPGTVQPGWFGPGKGWNDILSDLDILWTEGERLFPGLPVYILGHSMGSFLVRFLMARQGREPGHKPPAGVILSGSADVDPVSAGMMRFLAAAGVLFRGPRHPSALLHAMAFSANNKPYKNEGTTGVEWLSRDTGNNSRYAADPLCGFVCTTSFYSELGRGLSRIGRKSAFTAFPGEVPLLIAAGSRDPIGSCGKGPVSLDGRYRTAGVSDVTLYLVDGARHEILNETDKAVTWNFVRSWITGLE